MQKHLIAISIITSLLAAAISCSKDPVNQNSPNITLEELPYQQLSDYNFFNGSLAELQPNDGVIPYDLNSPLFSDYAEKSRFIWMPEGQAATYTDEGLPDFPVGTIIIKTFYFNNNITDPGQGRRILETRLLIKQDTAWQPASYIWTADQSEANFSIVGGQVNVEWTHYNGVPKSTNYYIPNKNDCKGCHNDDNRLIPIGPKARNLNKDFAYADGSMNQLQKWSDVGYLTNLPSLGQVDKLPVWDDESFTVNERARAYLEINCAHCHSPSSPADNSGLFLTYEEENPNRIGICKSPVATGGGSGTRSFIIVPGDPDGSIFEYRMNSTELDVAMPELARSVIHDEGVALINQWIAEMDPIPGNCM